MKLEQMTLAEKQEYGNQLVSEILSLHREIRRLEERKKALEEDVSYSQKLYDPSYWPSQADV